MPPGAVRAVLQFEKLDALGSIRLDDVRVTASPNPAAGLDSLPRRRRDRRVARRGAVTVDRRPRARSTSRSCCRRPPGARVRDASRTAGWRSAKEGGRGSSGSHSSPRRRFCRASRPIASPTGWPGRGSTWCGWATSTRRTGPNRSLFDDTRDDTKAFDPEALARLDHLIAALKSRGIYVAIELQSKRRFRSEDGVAAPGHAARRRRAGRPVRPDDRQADARVSPGTCSPTSTRRPAWLSATIRCWPGSRWPARSRSST